MQRSVLLLGQVLGTNHFRLVYSDVCERLSKNEKMHRHPGRKDLAFSDLYVRKGLFMIEFGL
jgi:hypothetical protein